jgi:hypothetical protein
LPRLWLETAQERICLAARQRSSSRAAAYLSAQRGGLLGTVLLTSVFPVLALTAAFLLMFPIGFVIERVIGRPVDFSIVATALLRDGVGWVLVPGVALLAGGFLVHLLFNRWSWSKKGQLAG